MTSNICPECRNEKHQNCTGEAWDDDKDEPAPCECAEEAWRQIRSESSR